MHEHAECVQRCRLHCDAIVRASHAEARLHGCRRALVHVCDLGQANVHTRAIGLSAPIRAFCTAGEKAREVQGSRRVCSSWTGLRRRPAVPAVHRKTSVPSVSFDSSSAQFTVTEIISGSFASTSVPRVPCYQVAGLALPLASSSASAQTQRTSSGPLGWKAACWIRPAPESGIAARPARHRTHSSHHLQR